MPEMNTAQSLPEWVTETPDQPHPMHYRLHAWCDGADYIDQTIELTLDEYNTLKQRLAEMRGIIKPEPEKSRGTGTPGSSVDDDERTRYGVAEAMYRSRLRADIQGALKSPIVDTVALAYLADVIAEWYSAYQGTIEDFIQCLRENYPEAVQA